MDYIKKLSIDQMFGEAYDSRVRTHEPNKVRLILILGALAAIGPLSVDMYLPAFPAIAKDLHTTSGPLGATLATFFVGLCLGQLIYGPVSDKVGRRTPLLFGLALYTAASIACSFATNVETLLVLRFLQALGSCAGMVVGRALIRDLFEPSETARVFSMIMLTMGIAPILAPMAGQWLTASFGWHSIFISTSLFAGLAGVAVFRWIPELKPHSASPWKASVFADLLKDRLFMGFALSGTFIQAGLFAYITGSPALFIERLGFTPTQFSWLFGLNALGLIAASQLNNWLLSRSTYQRVLEQVLKVSLGAAGLLLVTALLKVSEPLFVIAPLFVFVASLGLVFPNSTAGALSEQGKRAGSASAVLGTIQYGGAALASGLVGWLHSFTPAALEWTIALCALLSCLVFGSVLKAGDFSGKFQAREVR